MPWEVFRQDVFDGNDPPEGEQWKPFAAWCEMVHQRESLGGNYADGEVVWWRRFQQMKVCDTCGGTGFWRSHDPPCTIGDCTTCDAQDTCTACDGKASVKDS